MPPYLAGRTHEQDGFRRLLGQDGAIIENLVLTGLRGVGKTVLLETLKPIARQERWLWTGADMSESASITEDRLATRLITDLSVITSSILSQSRTANAIGFGLEPTQTSTPVDFQHLSAIYEATPGLTVDKLKRVLNFVWSALQGLVSGIVVAYDEAQILSDKSKAGEYPLSMLLELFQSVQRQGMNYLLVLTGLPTLFPKLVEARTYSERMFHVMFLTQLAVPESREAIVIPTQERGCPLTFDENTILTILRLSGGYPYFIQFICREIFDVGMNKLQSGQPLVIPEDAIVSKLDNDFFAARWERATDRERELLIVIASLPNCDEEFTVAETVNLARLKLKNPFSASQVNQMLSRMSDKGLVFKNRHGKYSFAVPLMSRFIRRQFTKYPDLFSGT
jgi:hypothetical protein